MDENTFGLSWSTPTPKGASSSFLPCPQAGERWRTMSWVIFLLFMAHQLIKSYPLAENMVYQIKHPLTHKTPLSHIIIIRMKIFHIDTFFLQATYISQILLRNSKLPTNKPCFFTWKSPTKRPPTRNFSVHAEQCDPWVAPNPIGHSWVECPRDRIVTVL